MASSNLSRVLSGMNETVITATNQVITVDPDTRQLNIPGIELVFGVEGDSGSERKYFQFPRYVGDNVDLAGSFLRVNYRNANGDKDFYLVNDVAVEGDSVVFSWKIHEKVVAYKGQVRFVVCVVGPDLKVKWHTTLGVGMSSEGLEPDADLEVTEDGVAALIAMVEQQTTAVENVGAEWVRNVQNEGTDQIVAVQTAAKTAETASVAEIEAKGVNTLESIPDDYTAVQNAVDALTRTRGAAIVCEAAGSAVVVNDASDMAIQGLRIFGRSTQDGTPTPEAPVEIKSVVEPVVEVCGRQILNLPNATEREIAGVTWSCSDGAVSARGTATEYSVTAGTISAKLPVSRGTFFISGSGEGVEFRVRATNKEGKQVYDENGVIVLDGSEQDFFGYCRVSPGVTVDTTIRPMVTLCESDHSWEAYSGQNLSTTHTLPGIPVTSGGNYTDSDGQQWICDEVDLERGAYVQRVGVRTFTGTESWAEGTSVLNGMHRYYTWINDMRPDNSGFGLCTHFPRTPLAAEQITSECVRFGQTNVAVFFFTPSIANTDTWVEYVTTLYDEGTPITIQYVLASPIETALSETEIAAYRAMHSNYPNTTVLNNAGAHMVVKYAADTKLYIDNKIAALIGG